jgi:hypothetical protein
LAGGAHFEEAQRGLQRPKEEAQKKPNSKRSKGPLRNLQKRSSSSAKPEEAQKKKNPEEKPRSSASIARRKGWD